MASSPGVHDAEPTRDGVVQLRFTDEDGSVRDIDAAELAQVLQGLVEFTSDMSKQGAFGDGFPPVVRVRPPKEGSFVIEAILQWAQTDPGAAIGAAMSTGGAIVQALNVGVRKLRGSEPANVEPWGDREVKIQWVGGGVSIVPVDVWTRLSSMKRPTRKALAKLMTPLNDDVQQLEIRDADRSDSTEQILASQPDLVVDRSDYRLAAYEKDEVLENVDTFSVEATLASVDFRPGEKWRVQTKRGTRLATLADDGFIAALDGGMALHKNDIFDVTVREVSSTTNGRTSREWTLTRVMRRRRGSDDDAQPETGTPSAPKA